MKLAIRCGLMSQSEAVQQLGYDPKEHFEEMAADNEMLDGLGLKWDSDGRKGGQASYIDGV